jgi:hypothetical protein
MQIEDTATKNSNYLFYAKLDNAKVLYNLAKAVNFKEVLNIYLVYLIFPNLIALFTLFFFLNKRQLSFAFLKMVLK